MLVAGLSFDFESEAEDSSVLSFALPLFFGAMLCGRKVGGCV